MAAKYPNPNKAWQDAVKGNDTQKSELTNSSKINVRGLYELGGKDTYWLPSTPYLEPYLDIEGSTEQVELPQLIDNSSMWSTATYRATPKEGLMENPFTASWREATQAEMETARRSATIPYGPSNVKISYDAISTMAAPPTTGMSFKRMLQNRNVIWATRNAEICIAVALVLKMVSPVPITVPEDLDFSVVFDTSSDVGRRERVTVRFPVPARFTLENAIIDPFSVHTYWRVMDFRYDTQVLGSVKMDQDLTKLPQVADGTVLDISKFSSLYDVLLLKEQYVCAQKQIRKLFI